MAATTVHWPMTHEQYEKIFIIWEDPGFQWQIRQCWMDLCVYDEEREDFFFFCLGIVGCRTLGCVMECWLSVFCGRGICCGFMDVTWTPLHITVRSVKSDCVRRERCAKIVSQNVLKTRARTHSLVLWISAVFCCSEILFITWRRVRPKLIPLFGLIRSESFSSQLVIFWAGS